MAVGMLQMLQGATKEQYEAVNQELFGQSAVAEDRLPQGLIMHSAGPAEGGCYVYDLWESKEDFERFSNGDLGAALNKVFGDAPAPPGSEPHYVEGEGLAVAG